MSCKAPNSTGSDGRCYAPCPAGYSPFGNTNLQCIQNCPPGFSEAAGGCIRPRLPRDKKPFLQCPAGADRIAEQCWLPCPTGTVAEFEVCKPVCPEGFVESGDGMTCEAEFVKRQAEARPACFPGEERLNNLCLSACPEGMTTYDQDATLCKYVVPQNVRQYFNTVGFVSAKIVFGRNRVDATCLTGYSTAGNDCYSECPLNSDALTETCLVRCPVGFTQYEFSCARNTISRTMLQGLGGEIGGTIIKVFIGFVILFFLVRFLAGAVRRPQ